MLMGNDRLLAATLDTKQDAKASTACVSGYCDTCDAEMTLLGTLPAIRLQSAVHVFRCFACNSVMSHEI
jgi:hypothetical protein